MEVCRGMVRRQNIHDYFNSDVDYISTDLMRIKDHKSTSKKNPVLKEGMSLCYSNRIARNQ